MKKLLNTLYITSEGAYLRKDGETIAVDIDGTTRARAPAHLLGQIVCFGQVAVSPALMGFASEAGITISFLAYSGKLLARVEGPQTGNVLLRRAQHEATKAIAALPAARAIVAAKVANQRALLRRHLRDYPDAPGASRVDASQRRLSDVARHALTAPDLDTLRGQEGEAGHAYWTAFANVIRNPNPTFAFARAQPPPASGCCQRGPVIPLCADRAGCACRLRKPWT